MVSFLVLHHISDSVFLGLRLFFNPNIIKKALSLLQGPDLACGLVGDHVMLNENLAVRLDGKGRLELWIKAWIKGHGW